MGWPELPASLDLLSDSWDDAPAPFEQAQIDINSAWSYWNAADDHQAIQHTLYGLQHLHDAVDYMLCYIYMFSPKTCLCAVLYQMQNGEPPPEYELTMLEILKVMSIATPDELMAFIAVTDAYKSALWDRPYNPEYYSTFVRHFKLWP